MLHPLMLPTASRTGFSFSISPTRYGTPSIVCMMPARSITWATERRFRDSPANELNPSLEREQLPAEPGCSESPQAARRPHHDDDSDDAQHQEIDASEIGEGLTQHEEDQRSDNRPLDRADAADDDDEDDEGGPVVGAECRIWREPQLLQKDQRSQHRRAEGAGAIDHQLDAPDVDAIAARGNLVVAHGCEREAVS